MCLTLKSTKTRQEARNLKPLIAKKDIYVYKVFDRNEHTGYELHSPYRGFLYKLGLSYSAKLSKHIYHYRSAWEISIHRGLHCYKTKKGMLSDWGGMDDIDVKNSIVALQCIVPKGSEYYQNDNEIASNQLILPEKLVNIIPVLESDVLHDAEQLLKNNQPNYDEQTFEKFWTQYVNLEDVSNVDPELKEHCQYFWNLAKKKEN
jgi:hypothetical protein